MRLSELHDSLGEITDERILSGSNFYVSPRDNRTRRRIGTLRKQGHTITSLGKCRFRCKRDPIGNKLKTDGTPFYNTYDNQAERYRLAKRGYVFMRVGKGVFKCTKVP